MDPGTEKLNSIGTSPIPPTFAQMNDTAREFWELESRLLLRRISDPFLFQAATGEMESEYAQRIPLKLRKSLEQALAEAERSKITQEIRTQVHRELAQKGGRAQKADRLTKLIQQQVSRNPSA